MSSKKFTKDTISKLAGLLPSNNDFTIDFTPDIFDEVDKQYRPIFVLSPWSNKQVKEIAKHMTANEESSNDEYIMSMVRPQIVDWRNYTTCDGKTIPHGESAIASIPQRCLVCIIQELLRISGLSS